MSARKPPRGTGRRRQRDFVDPNQIEFGIIWQPHEFPFRLRAGMSSVSMDGCAALFA